MSNTSKNDLNKEYIYVRRLISVLTNDDSDKPIVEKLKGKNLSSLMYNAKIIDNSKNMTANKKILACVIRAIEREKHLCHKRELEQSWGRKFLSSFTCLYPGLRSDDDSSAQFFRDANDQRSSHKVIKRRTMSRRTKTPSKTSCRHSIFKKSGCDSSVREMNKARITDNRSLFQSHHNIDSITKRTFSCVDSISSVKPDDQDDDYFNECPKLLQQYPVNCLCKYQKMTYATVRPPLLKMKKLNCVMVYPGRPLPAIRRVEKAEKKTSSTQTPDPEPLEPNNIKLQNLLEAASNLINTQDQREYVKSFLSNFEPPFDLSAGFPPYLKLPMKKSEDIVGTESVYGTNSELSIRSYLLSPDQQPETTKEVTKQKEDNVRKYVRDMICDPWQDTAESIISGVINETLPHHKADYSQLGACILKRLGAYPVSSTYHDSVHRRPNLNIPEIILQCTEFFESDAGDSDQKPEPVPQEPKQESRPVKSPSIEEMKLLDDGPKPWDSQKMQNYCFIDGEIANKDVGLLNLSQSSLVDVGTSQNNNQDRKNLQLRKPLKITPSGLEQGGKKPNKAGIFERRCETKTAKIPDNKRIAVQPNLTPDVKSDVKSGTNVKKPDRPKVSIYTVTSEYQQKPVESDTTKDLLDGSVIECIPMLKPETLEMTNQTLDVNHCNINSSRAQVPMPSEITETPTPPPELSTQASMEEVETFDGVGEGQTTEQPLSRPDKKQLASKGRSFQDKFRGKKKCKGVSKKKPKSDKNDMDSRNCRVM